MNLLYLSCRVNQDFQDFQDLRDQKVIRAIPVQKDERENRPESMMELKVKRFVNTF